MPLRILVTSFGFDERKNYQEVICARAYARMGCDVQVLTGLYTPGPQPPAWRVARVEKFLRIRDTMFFPRGLQKIVDEFQPDVALLYAPNHGLSYAVARHLPSTCRVVPVFGDLRESHHGRAGKWLTVRGNPLFKRLVKDRWYRRLMKRADLILAVTNETVRLLREVDAAAWDARGFMCGLAADPAVFFHDPVLRPAGDRRKTLVTVTRIMPQKPVVQWVQPVLHFLRKHPDWCYVLAGLPPGPEGEAVKNELLAAAPPGQLEIRPLLSPPDMNAAFNEADLAVWYLPTISIQQSMVTGLPVLLPANESVNHLVREGMNGFYYRSPEHLEEQLELAAAKVWDRTSVAEENKRLASPGVFAGILERLNLQT
jgi:glycosyltransferase involved in cell wall biosynthesis